MLAPYWRAPLNADTFWNRNVSPELENEGFVLARGVVGEPQRRALLYAVSEELLASPVRHRAGSAFAARGLLWKARALAPLLDSCGITQLASRLLGRQAFAIDATYFDKHARANWTVPGHQDRVVPVADNPPCKHRVRDTVAYSEPDAEALAALVALRIHFDDTDADTGALCLVPGSHRSGVLTTAQILGVPLDRYLPCVAGAGDVLALRPLLLHRSSPSRGEGQRRVLHVLYAFGEPGFGIRWRRTAIG